MDEKFQREILKRLDVLIRLVATSSLKDANLTDRISFLDKFGFSPKEISEMLNTTNNYVSVILSRKKGKKQDDKEQAIEEQPIVVEDKKEVQNA